MSDKKILILTASIGSGHIKAAEAVAEAIKALSPAALVTTVDWTDKGVSPSNYLTKKIYLNMLAFVPNLYDLFYKFSESKMGGVVAHNLNDGLMRRTVEKLFAVYEPDAVICTHPFPAGAAAAVKRRGGNFFLASVITDYTLHQMYLNRGLDMFFVPTEDVRRDLIGLGAAEENVFAGGIPVGSRFSAMPNKSEMRRRLNLATTAKVVLLMGGGLGLGGIENTVRNLENAADSLTVFVLVGKNENLLNKLQKQTSASKHRYIILGYTENVADYMRAADVIVTKPGALTLSESFVLGLPQILHEPIPGPETENARYAVAGGAAVWAKDDVCRRVTEILSSDVRRRQMEKAALSLARPNAAADIAKRILEFC